jgi:hypothetical protein
MHSDIRQSATDLAVKTHCSLQQNDPSLREMYRGRSVGHGLEKSASGNKELSREPWVAVSRIDQNQATGQPMHDQAPDPSHSFGMWR